MFDTSMIIEGGVIGSMIYLIVKSIIKMQSHTTKETLKQNKEAMTMIFNQNDRLTSVIENNTKAVSYMAGIMADCPACALKKGEKIA